MRTSAGDEWSSVSMFRLVGYSLLLLAVFDVVSTLLSPGPINSGWLFQTLGSLIERIPLPLIGLVLVFSGEANVRQNWEKMPLKVASWAALVVGIAVLLTIPMLLMATVQVNTDSDTQVSAQAEQQFNQLQTIEQQVNQASPQDLQKFLAQLNQQGSLTPTIKDPQSLRTQLLSEVSQVQEALKLQTEATRTQQRATVLKNAGKWSLGSLVAGVAFIRLWQMSNWARRKQRTKFRAANI